ncbi:isoprenylcysteine carboxylmethyltransferase family protein [Niastella caeni]|uniref:Isoprenylcysteine carboxylmethyltransferase family protein n=1 Tax=Niastella caeni TaxID=2569763 RepID=A0A4S8I3X9_9BACT|nr:isoprenylcysteine carboxylmethyltransferase family protein [Niastella caeni]THU41904.1 isoprenylcysteine carboxylmethyltransferase family protein [Niastella caeni]
MISIGNFFFRYRNFLFLFLYLALFIPSAPLFSPSYLGPYYYVWPVTLGLIITISGQLIRGGTIGLAYIIRGGKEGKVYAEELVTGGIFNHCRNPLYVGNILMLCGVGVLSNSLLYVAVFIPFFLFVYQAIVLAEEKFLRNKFGDQYNRYAKSVNRWVPRLQGISTTFKSMHFKWRRWILKEYNTQYIWLSGITLILLFKYPELTNYDTQLRNLLLAIILPFLLVMYLFVRYLKKSGKMRE